MRKSLKLTTVWVLAGVMVLSLFACGGTPRLSENEEWKNNPNLVQRNKEVPHTKLMSYENTEEALKGDYENSQYYLSLNGTWNFSLVRHAADVPATFMNIDYSTEGWNTINVPGNWETQGFSAPVYQHNSYPWKDVDYPAPNIPDENEIGLYKRTIDVPESWKNRETYISLEGVESACYIYVNGDMVGYGEDSYTTKEFRITSHLNYGKTNTIAIKVFKYSDASWLEAQDALKLGGIYRDVYLYSSPKTQIKDVYYDIQMTKSFDAALLKVATTIAAYDAAPTNTHLFFTLYDSDGGVVVPETQVGAKISFKAEKTGGANIAEMSGRINAENLHVWTAEDPYLYTSTVCVKDEAGNIVDIVSSKIGFRDAGFATDENGIKTFTINGTSVTLYGVVYNEHSAVNGKAVTREEMISDIQKMKSLNINAVRSPGQPFSSEFIDLCDTYGLYVISDVNLETEPWSRKDTQSIPGDQAIWQTAVLDRLVNVLERDKNATSVIMWSLGSQSGTGTNLVSMKNWLIENESRMILYDAYLSTDTDAGEKEYTTEADLIAATNWDVDKLTELINDKENTKPIVIQEYDKGLLNSAGGLDGIVSIIDKNANVQGGFLAHWIDRAIYTPKDKTNAINIIKDTPYSTNPELYELTYAASWKEYETPELAVSNNKFSLSGILSADRSLQSDAYEFKRAYAPIYVTALDVANGKFNVKNRNTLLNFEDNYEITYQIFSETTSVKTGTVEGLSLKPGASADISLDYSGISADKDCFVDITVKYKNTPKWVVSPETFDGVVSAMQFDITGKATPAKDGSQVNVIGPELVVDEFQAPVVETSAVELSNGLVYVTNPSSTPIDTLYSVSYQVVETNNYWTNPKPYIYAQGVIPTTTIAANAKYAVLKLPIDVKAIEDGTYFVNVILTTKTAIGSIPAGYALTYKFTSSSLNSKVIPFAIDQTRTPVPVVDEDDNQLMDENGALLWKEGIGDYAPKGNEIYFDTEADLNPIPTEHLVLKNDKVNIEFDVKTGLVKKFTIDGKEVFATADGETKMSSLMSSTYRNPTGGDYSTDAAKSENLERLVNATTGSGKTLLTDVVALKVDATHYRITLEYALTDYDTSVSLVNEYTTKYNVVYDIYANGVLNVSYAYDLSVNGEIPLALSNLITLNGDYVNMSWYGRGPGESYTDKLSNTRVDLYKDIPIVSTLDNYLMQTGSSDRSQVRWASFTKTDGSGVMLTSDTSNFAFNVSKSYPWETVAYARDVSAKPETILNVMGTQRGSDPSSLDKQNQNTKNSLIEPGQSYSFSYRIVPISSGENCMALSKQSLSSAGAASARHLSITNNALYALQNFSSDKQYVTSNPDSVILSAGLGSDNQVFIAVKDKVASSKAVRLLSSSHNLFLAPVGTALKKESLEIGLAPDVDVSKVGMQTWELKDNEMVPAAGSYSMAVMGGMKTPGSRLAMRLKEGRNDAAWTMIYDAVNKDRVLIKNNLTGLYVTAVDNVTYESEIIKNLDYREFNYSPSTDWTKNNPVNDPSRGDWTQTYGHITQWDLLPSAKQQWQFINVSGNGYKIFNQTNQVYLGIREQPVLGTTTIQKTLVEYDPNNVDELPASIVWQIDDRNGAASIINKDFGLALQSSIIRTKMTKAEMDYNFITDAELAFKDVFVLIVAPWQNMPSQKWNLKSEQDLQVNIKLGTNWFKNNPDEK